jgi:hypothetical protein
MQIKDRLIEKNIQVQKSFSLFLAAKRKVPQAISINFKLLIERFTMLL